MDIVNKVNPKHEIRNPKQIQMSNDIKEFTISSSLMGHAKEVFPVFGTSSLFRICFAGLAASASIFGFRILRVRWMS